MEIPKLLQRRVHFGTTMSARPMMQHRLQAIRLRAARLSRWSALELFFGLIFYVCGVLGGLAGFACAGFFELGPLTAIAGGAISGGASWLFIRYTVMRAIEQLLVPSDSPVEEKEPVRRGGLVRRYPLQTASSIAAVGPPVLCSLFVVRRQCWLLRRFFALPTCFGVRWKHSECGTSCLLLAAAITPAWWKMCRALLKGIALLADRIHQSRN